MPFDAGLLSQLSIELNTQCQGARVEKVFQPERDEVLLNLRLQTRNAKLLLSANANYPRAHLTVYQKENPAVPPMFCMLLRKHLTGAVIKEISQLSFERVLKITFSAVSEIGDLHEKSLVLEVLGRQSNILLLDADGRIIDSLKKIDISEKASRQVIPGVKYALPDSRDKLSPISEINRIIEDISSKESGQPLEKALMAVSMGLSPLIAREIAYRVSGTLDKSFQELNSIQRMGFAHELRNLSDMLAKGSASPVLLHDDNGKAKDFTYIEITQYGDIYRNEAKQGYSELLDFYYGEKDRIESQNQKSLELKKTVNAISEKLIKKINLQKEDLAACVDRDKYRIYGELITANISNIVPGAPYALLPNYYDENYTELKVPLVPAKSAVQNAQTYFKKYQKLKNAEQVLTEQIGRNEEELSYIESVAQSIRQAVTIKDFEEIREELSAGKYIRNRSKTKDKKHNKPSEPAKYQSADGFTILVGRNNVQNDYLTFRIAEKSDIWFHTLNIPGSHVILKTQGNEPSNTALTEAAQLAAFYSKASASSQVPVTFTEVKHVKKPSGAKPGFVIFTNYKTAFVAPKQL